MAAGAFVRARIDEGLKKDAASVLAEMGLTVSDAVRMTLTRIARDKALPFELNRTPNPETLAAMEEARAMTKARNARFASGEALIHDLDQEAR